MSRRIGRFAQFFSPGELAFSNGEQLRLESLGTTIHAFDTAQQLLRGFENCLSWNLFDAVSVTKGTTPAAVRSARAARELLAHDNGFVGVRKEPELRRGRAKYRERRNFSRHRDVHRPAIVRNEQSATADGGGQLS